MELRCYLYNPKGNPTRELRKVAREVDEGGNKGL